MAKNGLFQLFLVWSPFIASFCADFFKEKLTLFTHFKAFSPIVWLHSLNFYEYVKTVAVKLHKFTYTDLKYDKFLRHFRPYFQFLQ